jgi:hypothetical protein
LFGDTPSSQWLFVQPIDPSLTERSRTDDKPVTTGADGVVETCAEQVAEEIGS